MRPFEKVCILVLDSLGVRPIPDDKAFGDADFSVNPEVIPQPVEARRTMTLTKTSLEEPVCVYCGLNHPPGQCQKAATFLSLSQLSTARRTALPNL